MNPLLQRMLNRIYRDTENGDGSSNAGSNADTSGGSDDSGPAIDWEGLNDGVAPGADDEDPEGSEPSGEAPPATPTGAKPAEAPPAKPTLETDPADPGSEAPPEPLTPVDPDQPAETPEEAAARQAKLVEDFNKWEQAETERLSTEVYTFSDDDAARLQTEPELVLPRMAAQVHLAVMKSTLEAVQRMLPQMLPQFTQAQTVEKEATDFFYSQNPDLKKYHKQVLEAGKMFRRMNPKATKEVAAKQIGDLVRISLGLEKVAPTETGAAPAAVKPTPRTAPHKPAMPGSGGGVKVAPAKPAGDSLWDEMAMDDD